MQLDLPPELEAFRQEVRDFIATDYPADLIEKQRLGVVLGRTDQVRNQQALQARGWLAPAWPAEHGGPGWSAAQRYVFEEELDRADVPSIVPMGIIYVGPVIYTFGTDEQKRRWLPDILSSQSFWAQGYSEPEAGSDLASLKMTAERQGDHYILNGSKIWTSYAHWADWIFCLVRTSNEGRRQDGISFICAEMTSPGLTVHPIWSIDGVHHLNRVDFDNVRVPVSQRIGEEGRGWHYANFLLQGERLSYAHVSRKREDLAVLRRLAEAIPSEGEGSMMDMPAFANRVADCAIEVDMLDMSVRRLLAAQDDAAQADVSSLKIAATQCTQKLTELFIELAGPSAAAFSDRSSLQWHDEMPLTPPFAAPAMANYLFQRAQTIYGGASEVQKTLIWRMLSTMV